MATSVVIVDDHSGFRLMAKRMLQQGGYEVIGEAATGEAAVVIVTRLKPQLVLLDIQLPDLDGFAVAELLSELNAVVVLTSSRSASDYGYRLTHCSACGFIPKAELSVPALTDLMGAAR